MNSSPDWRVEPATRATVERHAEALAALDDELRDELGDAYSDEAWAADAFRADRPGKWRLSHLALVRGQPCAFWIASLVGAEAHTHRVGVSSRWRRRGIVAALAEAVHHAASAEGALRMTLYVSSENGVARAAYRRLGYRDCTLEGRAAMERLLCE
jgi:ribosomal protein S18 acetylase RimI-like enzyme